MKSNNNAYIQQGSAKLLRWLPIFLMMLLVLLAMSVNIQLLKA